MTIVKMIEYLVESKVLMCLVELKVKRWVVRTVVQKVPLKVERLVVSMVALKVAKKAAN